MVNGADDTLEGDRGIGEWRAGIGGAGGGRGCKPDGDLAAIGGAVAHQVGEGAIAVPHLDIGQPERDPAADAKGIDRRLRQLDISQQPG